MKNDVDRRRNGAKVGLLLIVPVIAVLALVALRPKDEAPPPVAETFAPPPVEAVKKPAPPPEPVPAEPAPENMEAFRAALLGDGDEDQPKGIAALEQRAKENAERSKARKRPSRRDVEDDPGETNEALEASSGGGLSDAAFRRTIEEWRGMKSCVQSSKSRTEEATGALRMALKIADNGDVVECRVFDESNDAAKLVARCVERQVRTLKFPAFDGDEPVVKEAKFVF